MKLTNLIISLWIFGMLVCACHANAAVYAVSTNGTPVIAPAVTTPAQAATAVSFAGKTVHISSPYVISTFAWPADRELVFDRGGYVTGGAITGRLNATPEDYGAGYGIGVTAAVQYAADSIRSTGGTVMMNGAYTVTSPIVLNNPYAHVAGIGSLTWGGAKGGVLLRTPQLINGGPNSGTSSPDHFGSIRGITLVYPFANLSSTSRALYVAVPSGDVEVTVTTEYQDSAHAIKTGSVGIELDGTMNAIPVRLKSVVHGQWDDSVLARTNHLTVDASATAYGHYGFTIAQDSINSSAGPPTNVSFIGSNHSYMSTGAMYRIKQAKNVDIHGGLNETSSDGSNVLRTESTFTGLCNLNTTYTFHYGAVDWNGGTVYFHDTQDNMEYIYHSDGTYWSNTIGAPYNYASATESVFPLQKTGTNADLSHLSNNGLYLGMYGDTYGGWINRFTLATGLSETFSDTQVTNASEPAFILSYTGGTPRKIRLFNSGANLGFYNMTDGGLPWNYTFSDSSTAFPGNVSVKGLTVAGGAQITKTGTAFGSYPFIAVADTTGVIVGMGVSGAGVTGGTTVTAVYATSIVTSTIPGAETSVTYTFGTPTFSVGNVLCYKAGGAVGYATPTEATAGTCH